MPDTPTPPDEAALRRAIRQAIDSAERHFEQAQAIEGPYDSGGRWALVEINMETIARLQEALQSSGLPPEPVPLRFQIPPGWKPRHKSRDPLDSLLLASLS
jgi:hypothetical protein